MVGAAASGAPTGKSYSVGTALQVVVQLLLLFEALDAAFAGGNVVGHICGLWAVGSCRLHPSLLKLVEVPPMALHVAGPIRFVATVRAGLDGCSLLGCLGSLLHIFSLPLLGLLAWPSIARPPGVLIASWAGHAVFPACWSWPALLKHLQQPALPSRASIAFPGTESPSGTVAGCRTGTWVSGLQLDVGGSCLRRMPNKYCVFGTYAAW